MKRRKALSSIEYASLIVVIVAALIGMSVYLKRAILGKWRDAGDSFGQGRQYEVVGCSGTPTKGCDDFFESPSGECEDSGGCSSSAPSVCQSAYMQEFGCRQGKPAACGHQEPDCSVYVKYFSCAGTISCAAQNNAALCQSLGCKWAD